MRHSFNPGSADTLIVLTIATYIHILYVAAAIMTGLLAIFPSTHSQLPHWLGLSFESVRERKHLIFFSLSADSENLLQELMARGMTSPRWQRHNNTYYLLQITCILFPAAAVGHFPSCPLVDSRRKRWLEIAINHNEIMERHANSRINNTTFHKIPIHTTKKCHPYASYQCWFHNNRFLKKRGEFWKEICKSQENMSNSLLGQQVEWTLFRVLLAKQIGRSQIPALLYASRRTKIGY